MIPIPVSFSEILAEEITRGITDRMPIAITFTAVCICAHGALMVLALFLASGMGPGARRAIRRPSTRPSPVTNSAVPTGRPVLWARRSAAKASSYPPGASPRGWKCGDMIPLHRRE